MTQYAAESLRKGFFPSFAWLIKNLGTAGTTGIRCTPQGIRVVAPESIPAHFTMHSFRVGGSLRKSLAGTPVDEFILQLGGWKTEAMARHYIGATTREAFDVSQTVDQLYDRVNKWSASSDFQERYAACGSRYNSTK